MLTRGLVLLSRDTDTVRVNLLVAILYGRSEGVSDQIRCDEIIGLFVYSTVYCIF